MLLPSNLGHANYILHLLHLTTMTIKRLIYQLYLLSITISFIYPTIADNTQSINAYIPAHHKLIYEKYNALILGDLSVAKAAFRGSLAVMGRAEISDFDIASSKDCDKDVRSIVVGKSLVARMGSINGGYTVLGRGSKVHHTVRMPCTTRVEQYDPRRNGDIDFAEARSALNKETGDLCVTPTTGEVQTENETMKFVPGEERYSCYNQFKVSTRDLRLINKWEFAGNETGRNNIIAVVGLRNEFRDFRMDGFNPRRTLIVFCAVRGSFGLYNTRFQGSILAPGVSFTTMDTIMNGSLIIGGLRGSLATLFTPYETC